MNTLLARNGITPRMLACISIKPRTPACISIKPRMPACISTTPRLLACIGAALRMLTCIGTALRMLALVAGLLCGGAAHAVCTVVCSCSVSTTPVVFGNINPLSASATDSTGSVKVDCGGTVGLLIPLRVDLGTGGGSYTSRRMSSGARTLAYNLYTDAARSQVWGDGSGGTGYGSGFITLDAFGLSPTLTLWVYGRVPAGQTGLVPASGYKDTISVLLTYY